ncbi:MAG: DNA gyrase inhibitor YacG [Bdellovibrionales bacterium]
MKEGARCPICSKPMVEKYKPFCSSRCSMIDLGKWLGEGYKLESAENDEEIASLPNPEEGENCE